MVLVMVGKWFGIDSRGAGGVAGERGVVLLVMVVVDVVVVW